MITAERLHEMFEYRDGVLYRKISLGCTKAWDVAGFVNDRGYTAINIGKQCIGAHRLIWMMHHGFMPKLIDHIDGNRSNNRIENLREADRNENSHNKSIHRNNTSGCKGVTWHKKSGKWLAQIVCRGKHHYLGVYESIDQANNVVRKARDMLHGAFANHGIEELKAKVAALEGAA
jgi:hypothetical protein